jgi:hypothetical protein
MDDPHLRRRHVPVTADRQRAGRRHAHDEAAGLDQPLGRRVAQAARHRERLRDRRRAVAAHQAEVGEHDEAEQARPAKDLASQREQLRVEPQGDRLELRQQGAQCGRCLCDRDAAGGQTTLEQRRRRARAGLSIVRVSARLSQRRDPRIAQRIAPHKRLRQRLYLPACRGRQVAPEQHAVLRRERPVGVGDGVAKARRQRVVGRHVSQHGSSQAG